MKNERILNSLRSLQQRQYRHDQLAHQDIALTLALPARLTHFTLHFAKYLGALTRATRESDSAMAIRAIADTFIIALASANAMNVDLQDRAAQELSGEKKFVRNDRQAELGVYAELVGDMAKACEATDHLEAFPSRTVLEQAVTKLIPLTIRLANSEDLDLLKVTEARWEKAEAKSFVWANETSTRRAPSKPRAA